MQRTNHSTYVTTLGKGRMLGILLLCLHALMPGQFYEYGQDAGNLKWEQLTTPNYRVIYPRGVDSVAQAFADRLEYYHPHLGEPLDHRHRSIPVIVHNESSFSNGVFVWAPKRLEIFTNPDPNAYPQDWLTELALHEGRHAVQIDMLDQGITRALSYLGGEQVVGAIAGFLPYWYLEGDAVDAETRLSMTGRGRQPSFEMELKAQLLEQDRLYSYSKAVMGSYRNYIPNHYKLGYLMVRHGRRNYGDSIWIDFQNYAARKPYLISPSFFSLRKYGISSKPDLYRDALREYGDHWKTTASVRKTTPLNRWEDPSPSSYTSYTFPHFVSGSLVFALKSGLDQIPEFVFLGNKGEEKTIYKPGFLSSGRISFSGTHVVWDEFVPDIRWSNRNYSVIRTYEIASGRVRNLGRKTRYYSPDVSANGSRIVAIEQSANQRFHIVILDLDGTLQKKIPSPGNRHLQHPSWLRGDSALAVVRSDANGKTLYRYSLKSNTWQRLFDAGFEDISYPVAGEDHLFFSGTFSGIDNIYCLDLEDREVYQVTSARFGAFQPQVSGDGRMLAYADYTSRGYSLATMPLDKGVWIPLENARDDSEQLDNAPTPREISIIREASHPDTSDYPSRPYRKWLNLFNFHSWLPAYFDYLNPTLAITPEHLPVRPGLSLVSQNRLSTAVSQLGYEYRSGNHLFHSGIQFKGRFPVVNLYFDYGGDPDVLLRAEGDSLTSLPEDLRFRAQTYIPLRFNTGKYLSLLQPRINYSYARDIQYVLEEGEYRTGAHYLYYTLFGTTYLRRGHRDIMPRLGISASGGYYHAPFGHRVVGSVYRAGLTGYIPGILRHQTIKWSVNHQKQFPVSMSRPAFVNLISLPRGIRGVFGEVLTTYSLDYVTPLAYPDLELGWVLYLKRIRGSVWTDHMVGKNVIVNDPDPVYTDRNYTTLGMELVGDLHLLRFTFPMSIGGRVVYEPETASTSFEFIYGIDIN